MDPELEPEMPFVTSSFLFLVERPGATSSVLATSSDARVPSTGTPRQPVLLFLCPCSDCD